MLSSSRKLIVPLFVYLSLLLATAVEAHDVPLHLRDHGNMKRLMKKRSPFPDGEPIVPAPVAGAAGIPTLSSTDPVASSAASTSVATNSATGSSSAASTSSSASGTTSSSSSAASSSASSTASSTQTSATSAPTTAAAKPSASLNIIDAPVPSTSTIVAPTITRTASIGASSPAESISSLSGAAATSDNNKSITLTVLIAVAASVGGIAILWTVFRKWKLSSSKKFDERLRPIDWQQPTEDDGAIPTHRRHSGASSFRSGPGHSDSGSRAHDPLDHDFTAGASTVGGYADLSRGPTVMPPMQEHVTRGPSFNRQFDNGVPLHHQGYGGTRY